MVGRLSFEGGNNGRVFIIISIIKFMKAKHYFHEDVSTTKAIKISFRIVLNHGAFLKQKIDMRSWGVKDERIRRKGDYTNPLIISTQILYSIPDNKTEKQPRRPIVFLW